MAAHTSGVSKRMALGGFSFMVSDILIGFGIAGWEFPFRGVVVGATYTLGQYLIVTGWSEKVQRTPIKVTKKI